MALLNEAAIPSEPCDVVAVGGGIAGLTTALAAAEQGARVALLEKASPAERGGNTRFADAQIRFPHEADEYCAGSYTPEEFRDDLMRLSRGRANPELIDVLVAQAAQTVDWLSGFGVQWEAGYPHTAGYRRMPTTGGQGLVDLLFRRAEGLGVVVSYETPAQELLLDEHGRVRGVRARSPRSECGVTALYNFQAYCQYEVALGMERASGGRKVV